MTTTIIASSSTLSDLLGYASIGCWLGAQFPQLIENHKRRSVEGLAWPFLANWLAGDVSNLVGCILTHQLPFQTYLATYFCCVDVSLVGQYIYYSSTAKPKPLLPGRLRSSSSATITGRLSIERSPAHYRTLSHVAANVAAAAALAAQQEERMRLKNSHSYETDGAHWDDDEVDEAALGRLADSFHSEGGRSRKKVSWSRERGGSVGRHHRAPTMSPIMQAHPSLTVNTSPTLTGAEEVDSTRGRPLARQAPLVESPASEWTNTSTAQRRSSRASRKGAAMVFLGVWVLFGVGTLSGGGRGAYSSGRGQMGKVLVRDEPPEHSATFFNVALDDSLDRARPASDGSLGRDASELSFDQLRFADDIPLEDPPGDNGPPVDYIIGRISAWICTTLYLTSRLPQIWKNYVRKSVDGLSMSLFVFAFMGNFLYVASILTSPKLGTPEPESSAFLRESIPYLLGSGGTLMFDVTIVTQSFLYRSRPHNRGRHLSRSVNEEEEGLLSAGATGAEDLTTPSRRRPTTASESAE